MPFAREWAKLYHVSSISLRAKNILGYRIHVFVKGSYVMKRVALDHRDKRFDTFITM